MKILIKVIDNYGSLDDVVVFDPIALSQDQTIAVIRRKRDLR